MTMDPDQPPPPSEPVSSPQPRAGRLVAGLVLLIIGGLMIPTVALTAIGIVICIAGAVLIAFAFVAKKYQTDTPPKMSRGRTAPDGNGR